jgi:hypothetical protein
MLRSWHLLPHQFAELSRREQVFIFDSWNEENKPKDKKKK